MEDREIIALYWARNDRAIAASGEKYGGYCFTVAQNILGSPEDSEECVNDTWLSAWNAMPPHRPNVLRLFFARLTRAHSFNRYKARTAQKRGGGELAIVLEELSECIAGPETTEDAVLARELGASIRRFVGALPEREASLFLRRYFYTEPLKVIANRYHMTENYTSVILHRVRNKLKQQLIQEGYFDESNGFV